MLEITEKSKCCGCSACQAVCPHDAITMSRDALGFAYPSVAADKCVKCGLCIRVCDFNNKNEATAEACDTIKVSAARNRDDSVLENSQSGGVFTSLATDILNGNGTVYGAAMNADFTVSHHRVDSISSLPSLRGSKYVQSDMDDMFRRVREDLESGRKVLFSGTPCQVAGLVSYIPERLRHNLHTVDFICHGVPSPAIWHDYVSYMSSSGRIVGASFRDKSEGGWKRHVETFTYDDGRKVARESFRVLFYKNIMLRPSCAACPYHYDNRKSDVTIGDFWGIGELSARFDGDEGTSMVICNTDKGRSMLEDAGRSLDICELAVGKDFLLRKNPNLLRSSVFYKDSCKFAEEYASHGFLHVARKWGDMGWRYKAWQLKVWFKKLSGLK